MKHELRTPQGKITIEPIGKKGDPAILVIVTKAGFGIPFPLTIKPEHAQILHSALGMALEELEAA